MQSQVDLLYGMVDSCLLLCFRVAASVEQTEAGEEAGAALSLDSGQWTEEKALLLAKLELLERTKNEEMQNLKTSLIAEQQVSNKKIWSAGILLLAPFELKDDFFSFNKPNFVATKLSKLMCCLLDSFGNKSQ